MLFLQVSTFAYAQDKISIFGVVERAIPAYNEGDTVLVYAIRQNENSGRERYMVLGTEGFTFHNEDRIRILDQDVQFWDMVWLRNRAETIHKTGWEKKKRMELREDAIDYYVQAETNEMIFKDDHLYDYLYKLVHKIHPLPFRKETASHFRVLVLTSTEPNIFAFDNGMIIMTTGLLASLESEEALVEVLATAVAHCVMEHNLVNLNLAIRAERRARIWGGLATVAASTLMAMDEIKNGTQHDYFLANDLGRSVYFLADNILDNIGAKYDESQREKAELIGLTLANSGKVHKVLEPVEYHTIMANSVSFAALQEYIVKNYYYAQNLLLGLHDVGIATDRDYLLLSQLQRKAYDSRESDELALEYLQLAKEKSLSPLIELEKELALVYQRLGEPDKAHESLLSYRDMLIERRENGGSVQQEIQRVEQMIQRKSYQLPGLSEKETPQYESPSSN